MFGQVYNTHKVIGYVTAYDTHLAGFCVLCIRKTSQGKLGLCDIESMHWGDKEAAKEEAKKLNRINSVTDMDRLVAIHMLRRYLPQTDWMLDFKTI